MKVVVRFLVLSVLVLVVSRQTLADKPSQARAIINKAIKATGGLEALKKYPARTWSDAGKYFGMGEGLPYKGKYAVQWPDKYRMEIQDVFVIVVNGDKGWVSAQGNTSDLTKEQLAEQRKSLYCEWVTTLTPLSDKAFKLSLADGADDGNVSVKIQRDGERDVTLFFDKKTNLLVKSAFMVKPEEEGGKEVLAEYHYKDYKEFGGLKVATTIDIHHGGKIFVEARLSEIKQAEKLDDSVFAKP